MDTWWLTFKKKERPFITNPTKKAVIRLLIRKQKLVSRRRAKHDKIKYKQRINASVATAPNVGLQPLTSIPVKLLHAHGKRLKIRKRENRVCSNHKLCCVLLIKNALLHPPKNSNVAVSRYHLCTAVSNSHCCLITFTLRLLPFRTKVTARPGGKPTYTSPHSRQLTPSSSKLSAITADGFHSLARNQ